MFSEFFLHLCDERNSSIQIDVLTFKEVGTHKDERKEAARVRPQGGPVQWISLSYGYAHTHET